MERSFKTAAAIAKDIEQLIIKQGKYDALADGNYVFITPHKKWWSAIQRMFIRHVVVAVDYDNFDFEMVGKEIDVAIPGAYKILVPFGVTEDILGAISIKASRILAKQENDYSPKWTVMMF